MTKEAIKQWLDANVHDGDDRSGCKNDWVKHDPDELQELVEDCLAHVFRNAFKGFQYILNARNSETLNLMEERTKLEAETVKLHNQYLTATKALEESESLNAQMAIDKRDLSKELHKVNGLRQVLLGHVDKLAEELREANAHIKWNEDQ